MGRRRVESDGGTGEERDALAQHPDDVLTLPREGGRVLAHCPACSAGMVDRSCKRRCPRCGYFEDCSNLI